MPDASLDVMSLWVSLLVYPFFLFFGDLSSLLA